MAIPRTFEMFPAIIRCMSDEQIHSMNEMRTKCAEMFELTDAELEARTPGGYRTLYNDRFGRAVKTLKDAGLLSSPGRGFFRLTELGDEAYNHGPENIDLKYIRELTGKE